LSIDVRCEEGFTGTPVATCPDDEEDLIFSGCAPENCTTPLKESDAVGYAVIETDLERRFFNVSAQCTTGFTGVPVVKSCARDKEPYELTGCAMTNCVSKIANPPKGYVIIDETSLGTHHFRVDARCADNHFGTINIEPCTQPNQPYHLTGCEPGNCSSTSVVGYSAIENDLHTESFDVVPGCMAMYVGKATVKPCTHHGGPYFLSGCIHENCTSPSASAKSAYVVVEHDLSRPGLDVRAKCAEDTRVNGVAKVNRCKAPNTPYILSGCDPVTCTAPRGAEVAKNYTIDNADLSLAGWKVIPSCASGYVGTPVIEKCTKHGDPYKITGCIDGVCKLPEDTTGYVIENPDLHVHTWGLQIRCDTPNYAGVAKVEQCKPLEHQLEIEPEGCYLAKCTRPSTLGYEIDSDSEELHKINFSVAPVCAAGYATLGVVSAKACDFDGQPYKLDGCHTENCIEPHGVEAAGYIAIEKDISIPHFDVKGTCAEGYLGTMSATVCTRPDTAYHLHGCLPITCTQPETIGYAVFEGSRNVPDFQVTVSCGYSYRGNPWVEPCKSNNAEYIMGGCYPENCTVPSKVGYNVSEFSLQRGSFSVHVTCLDPDKTSPKAYACKTHGEPYILSGC